MRMTTMKLVLLRLFMITAGRIGWIAEGFKKFMVWRVIASKGEQKYVASSRFFTWDQLDDD